MSHLELLDAARLRWVSSRSSDKKKNRSHKKIKITFPSHESPCYELRGFSWDLGPSLPPWRKHLWSEPHYRVWWRGSHGTEPETKSKETLQLYTWRALQHSSTSTQKTAMVKKQSSNLGWLYSCSLSRMLLLAPIIWNGEEERAAQGLLSLRSWPGIRHHRGFQASPA